MTYQGITQNYPDTDLISSNIKDGVDIFGVQGNLQESLGGITSINGYAYVDVME